MNKKLIRLTEQDIHSIVKESVKKIIIEHKNDCIHQYINFINSVGRQGTLPKSKYNFIEYCKSIDPSKFCEIIFDTGLGFEWLHDNLFDKGIEYDTSTDDGMAIFGKYAQESLFEELSEIRIDDNNLIQIVRDIVIPYNDPSFFEHLYNDYKGLGVCWSFTDNTNPYCGTNIDGAILRLYGKVRTEDIEIYKTMALIVEYGENEIRVDNNAPIELNKIDLIHLKNKNMDRIPAYSHTIWKGNVIISTGICKSDLEY